MTQSQLYFHISAGLYQFPRHYLHQMVFVCTEGRGPSLPGIVHWQQEICPDLIYIAPTEQIRYFISMGP